MVLAKNHNDAMKAYFSSYLVGVIVFGVMIGGCGGGSGSSSGGGGNGTSASFSSSFTVSGGNLIDPTTPGIQDIQVTDVNGTQFTVASVLSPDSIVAGASVVVIRSGSKLLAGHYTSTAATYINPVNGNQTPLTLNVSGTISHDLVVPPGGIIILPIDRIGSFTFPNGVRVQAAAFIGHVANVNLSLAGSANLNDGNASTTFTFGGAGSPTGAAGIDFLGSGSVSVQPGGQGSSPFTANGTATGTSTDFPTAQVTYHYNN